MSPTRTLTFTLALTRRTCKRRKCLNPRPRKRQRLDVPGVDLPLGATQQGVLTPGVLSITGSALPLLVAAEGSSSRILTLPRSSSTSINWAMGAEEAAAAGAAAAAAAAAGPLAEAGAGARAGVGVGARQPAAGSWLPRHGPWQPAAGAVFAPWATAAEAAIARGHAAVVEIAERAAAAGDAAHARSVERLALVQHPHAQQQQPQQPPNAGVAQWQQQQQQQQLLRSLQNQKEQKEQKEQSRIRKAATQAAYTSFCKEQQPIL